MEEMNISASELKELEEHGHDRQNRRIGLVISILAILLAICGAAGRKAENLVIVSRVDASNTWSYFQAKKLRGFQSKTTADILKVVDEKSGKKSASIEDLAAKYEEQIQKYDEQSESIAKEAEAHTQHAEKWENRANRFGLGEIFLQIGVVLCSIAILTQAIGFVYGGLGFAAIGILCAISALFMG